MSKSELQYSICRVKCIDKSSILARKNKLVFLKLTSPEGPINIIMLHTFPIRLSQLQIILVFCISRAIIAFSKFSPVLTLQSTEHRRILFDEVSKKKQLLVFAFAHAAYEAFNTLLATRGIIKTHYPEHTPTGGSVCRFTIILRACSKRSYSPIPPL